MNKTLSKTIILLFLAVFLVRLPFIMAEENLSSNKSDESGLKNAITDKVKELEKISAEIAKTESNLNDVKSQTNSLKNDLTKISGNINQLNLKIKAGDLTVEKLNLEIQDLSGNINYLEDVIAKKREGIASLLRVLQQRDSEGLLFLMFKTGSLADSILEIESVSNMNNFLTEEVGNLKSLEDNLNKKVSEVSSKKTSIETENLNTKNRAAIVSDQKVERERLLALSKSQEKNYLSQLEKLQKQQEDLAEDIDDLEEELKSRFNTSLLPTLRRGIFMMPTAGRVTQEWGKISNLYRGKPHNGLDIGAPLGTPIYAARDGKVTAVKSNGRLQYGKYVLLEHDNGFTTLYAHMSRQAATEGASVKKGDIIGYVGDTGYSFGYHLHFGVYWTGSLTLKYFPGAGLVPVGVTLNPQDYI